MNHPSGQLLDDGRPRLYLVAASPLWIGAIKQAVRRQRSLKNFHVVEMAALADIPTIRFTGLQAVFLETVKSRVADVVEWLTARRTATSRFHLVAMVSNAELEYSAKELDRAIQWLHEAGATHVVTNVWELRPVMEVIGRAVAASPPENLWETLPLPLEAEGWHPPGRGDRF